jgi:spermidine/putrescine ABC transporter ATP-binding subunit
MNEAALRVEASGVDTADQSVPIDEAHVILEGITKEFGGDRVVDSLNVSIRRGEFFSLLGPSGCGKTTTLRMLAGFIRPSEGRIKVSGRDITAMPPESRNIGVVFQDYAIFPHMTVFENVAFGLKMRKQRKSEISSAVEEALTRVDLRGSEGKYRKQLSGGQQQRVALARALVIQPDVLLLDEPLSALDLKLRDQMRFWIRDIQRSLGITTIYVTHDQTEALTMSDRLGVMRSGHLLQTGTPRALYDNPEDLRVANFLGTATLIEGEVETVESQHVTMLVGSSRLQGRMPTGSGIRAALTPGTPCSLVLRPEQVEILGQDSGHVTPTGHQDLVCQVRTVSFEGPTLSYTTEVSGIPHRVLVHTSVKGAATDISVGDTATLRWGTDAAVVLPGHIEPA